MSTVSVVMAFYNAGGFIRETVESIFAQTWRDWELLLVDDGSTDESTAFARDCADRYPGRVRYLEHEGHGHFGITRSRNLGCRHSRGEYIAIQDADDIWVPEKLSRQAGILERKPEADVTHGTPLYWHSWEAGTSRRDYVRETGLPLNTLFEPPELLLRCYPFGTAVLPCMSDLMLRRRSLEAIGGFEESFAGRRQLYEDQAFDAKMFTQCRVFVAGECWTKYRKRPDSDSQRRTARDHVCVRGYYLDWLTAYLRRQGIQDGAVWSALGKARRRYRWQWLKTRVVPGW